MTTQPKNNQILIPAILGAILLIAIIGSGIWLFTQSSSSTSDSKSSSSPSSSSVSSINSALPIAGEALSLNNIEGQYTGTASILTGFLRFPKSDIAIQNSGATTLSASGLDLTILNYPEIQVDGSFPVADVKVQGQASVTNSETGDVKIQVSSLEVNLTVKGVKIPSDRQETILQFLSTKGIIIPTIDSANPTSAEVKIVIDSNNKALITSQIDSPILLNFSGTKS